VGDARPNGTGAGNPLDRVKKLALTEEGIRQALDRGTRGRAELHAILKKPGGVQELLNQPARWELYLKTAQGELVQARRLAVCAEGSLDAELTTAMDRFQQQVASDQVDYDLALRLERIRLDRATLAVNKFDQRSPMAEYQKAFARFGVLGDDPVVAAARLSSSPIREQLVAGLDTWAFCAFNVWDYGLAERLLTLARQAAADPAWGDRVRQVSVWENQEALEKLVAQAPTAGASPQLLEIVGERLRIFQSPLAISCLRRAQAKYPGDFWLNVDLAHALAPTKPAEAVGFYRAALAIRPGTAAVYNNLGSALCGQKELDEAIASYHKAIALDPKAAMAYINLGDALGKLGEFPKAIDATRKAIELDPDDPLAHHNLGYFLLGQGKVDDAIASYRKAIDLKPNNARTYTNLGKALLEKGKVDDAIAAYRKAIEIDPKHAKAYGGLGTALSKQRKLPEAIDANSKAIELDPNNAIPHGNLGLYLREQGKPADAVAACRRAIELDPNFANAYNILGLSLSDQGKRDDAIAAFRKAIELDPQFTKAHSNLGSDLARQGKFAEAATHYLKAIELDPKHTAAYIGMGAVASRQNKPGDAIAWYRKALAIEPDDLKAHENLSVLLAICPDQKFRNSQQAVEHAKKAVELEPRSSGALQILGWALYRAGAWRESIEALEKSCNLQAGGTGDAFQWIVLALAHAKLAEQEGLTDKEREHHKVEARRRYEESTKQIDQWWRVRPGGSGERAVWDFRDEARKLMGLTESKK
jgi:tetratricopeptide (TPR) repeat protein